MCNKIAILKSNLNSFERFYSNMLREHVEVFDLYNTKSIISTILLKLSFKMQLPLKKVWFKTWIEKLKNYNCIILFDSGATLEVISIVRKNNPYARLIFWNWNTGLAKEKVNLLRKLEYEIWSFDKKECLENNFMYNTQFYDSLYMLKNKKIKYDVLFVGKDKGRLNILIELKEKYFDKLNISYKYIIRKTEKKYSKNKFLSIFPISYKRLLTLISKTNCIIDLVKEGQEGITVRVLEGIFYRRKLITNNKAIKKYDFYNPNNIFILGEDRNIKNFISKPYINLNEDIIKRYKCSSWLSNFTLSETYNCNSKI